MPKTTNAVKEREVVYPRELARIYKSDPPPCPDGVDAIDWPYRPSLTVEQAKAMLGWETETEYAARLLKENAKLKPSQLHFAEPLLKDTRGERVVCWNNGKNRDLKLDWALSIAQDVLNGNWRINGEAVIVGRTGLVLSAQHRLIGFILAEQKRQDDEEWRKRWPEPLTLETYVSLGLPEDQKTVNTLDNTLARTDADAIRTIGLFVDWKVKDKTKGKDGKDRVVDRVLSNGERKECERMYAAATSLLWQRVGAGSTDEHHRYQTHSESAAFRDRHPKLLACVKHIFEENWDARAISNLRLSAGQSAACLYLMGSSSSDPAKYHGVDGQPGEQLLSWDRWDRACAFWSELSAGKLKAVGEALANPFGLKEATEASSLERLCVLAKAWGVHVGGKQPTVEQIRLKHVKDDVGVVKLDLSLEKPAFGGIDLGPKHEPQTEADELVQEANQRGVTVGVVMDERKAAAKEAVAKEMQAKLDAAKANKAAAKQTIAGAAFTKPAEKPVEARTTLPVRETPTHPLVKRVPLGAVKPAPGGNGATTAAAKPATVAARPTAKPLPPKVTAPTKPKGLNRTV